MHATNTCTDSNRYAHVFYIGPTTYHWISPIDKPAGKRCIHIYTKEISWRGAIHTAFGNTNDRKFEISYTRCTPKVPIRTREASIVKQQFPHHKTESIYITIIETYMKGQPRLLQMPLWIPESDLIWKLRCEQCETQPSSYFVQLRYSMRSFLPISYLLYLSLVALVTVFIINYLQSVRVT